MAHIVTIWDRRDALGSRHLQAELTAEGDVQIMGTDLGDGVEEFFGEGMREYEYALTIRAAAVPALQQALATTAAVLPALQAYFQDAQHGDPQSFLEEQGIPYEFWSRVGD